MLITEFGGVCGLGVHKQPDFVQRYGDEFQIQRISCCGAMGKRSRTKLARDLLQDELEIMPDESLR